MYRNFIVCDDRTRLCCRSRPLVSGPRAPERTEQIYIEYPVGIHAVTTRRHTRPPSSASVLHVSSPGAAVTAPEQPPATAPFPFGLRTYCTGVIVDGGEHVSRRQRARGPTAVTAYTVHAVHAPCAMCTGSRVASGVAPVFVMSVASDDGHSQPSIRKRRWRHRRLVPSSPHEILEISGKTPFFKVGNASPPTGPKEMPRSSLLMALFCRLFTDTKNARRPLDKSEQ